MEELEAYADKEIVLSVTYEEETVDINLSVEEWVRDRQKVMNEVTLLLKKMIQGELDSVVAADLSQSGKRKRNKPKMELRWLNKVRDRVSAWRPDTSYPNRQKGKVMYLELLGSLKALHQCEPAVRDSLQPILRRLQHYWTPLLTTTTGTSLDSGFMQELSTLTKECRTLPALRDTVHALLQAFTAGQ